jgi:hypothetical protein
MRTKIKRIAPDAALLRIMDALAQDAIEASDEEVTQAAAELRMDLNSRESAAFSGLSYFAKPQLSEFFSDLASNSLRAPAKEIAGSPRERRGAGHPRSKRST